MKSYATRQQVREINRKLFANDIIYGDDDNEEIFRNLLSDIIQNYNPEDALANVPTILEIKDDNITENTLDKLYLLSKTSVYLQFNNRVLGDQGKTAIIRKLKEAGYRIVIEINEDDEVFSLAKILADIVKFNIHKLPPAIHDKGNSFQCKTLAYNVNSAEDYTIAEATGITLYEGTYISNSIELKIEAGEHSNVNFMEIITLLNNGDVTAAELAKAISRDSLLSSQVIRLANSVYFASRNRVESINDAVVRIGLVNLKRWIFLLEFRKTENSPEELLQTSYQRAIFCEKIVKESHTKELKASEAYLIGLFSTLDILTGHSMDAELSSMNLSSVIQDALIYRDGVGGILINLVRAYEEANWTKVDKYMKTFKLSKDTIYKIYFSSINEVQELWRSMVEQGGIY